MKDCVIVFEPSVAESTTEFAPMSSSPGVPLRVLEDTLSQLGHVSQLTVMVSLSGSENVGVYVYASSSVALVTALLVKLGASLVSVIVTVYVTSAASLVPSLTVIV